MWTSRFFFWAILVVCLNSCGIQRSIEHRPSLGDYNQNIPKRVQINDSTYAVGDNYITKNEHGLWELYVAGDPLERGLIIGSLTRELIQNQENIFFTKVNDLVPNKTWQGVLRTFLSWYNRKMFEHIPEEYQAEIYGISRFSGHRYDEVAPPYLRSLYLHSAHDIGHALQDLALVGCSAFAVWGDRSADGNLLIGRNFDFYAGDDFAREKIITFISPGTGHKFMSYTWGGMIGVVSGMNEQGLSVTINAGKSKIPLVAKTPISLLAREILQYASSIEEAIEIAQKREVFVSEAIFVGSANDQKAVLIEVSPSNFGVYEVPNNADRLICSNHFQSSEYANDIRNLKWIKESHSQYRFDRMEELIDGADVLDVKDAVAILRNREGMQGEPLGYGNEKALNQLLAHHGIVFQPSEGKVYVSSNPYQLGEFVAYDIQQIFSEENFNPFRSKATPELNIPPDPFLDSQDYTNYEEYRVIERNIEQKLKDNESIDLDQLNRLTDLNPEYWKAHYLKGLYYKRQGFNAAALRSFEIARLKVVTTLTDLERIDTYIQQLKR